MDLHPYGCLVILAHYFSLTYPLCAWSQSKIYKNLVKSPLPYGHSPSRPRLKHPLLCYTVPWVIHLALPRFSHTERIPETLSSLTIKASLRISLPRRPSGLCYLNTTYFRQSWLITGFSWLSSSHFSFFLAWRPSSVLSGQIFSSHLYHMYTKIHETSS